MSVKAKACRNSSKNYWRIKDRDALCSDGLLPCSTEAKTRMRKYNVFHELCHSKTKGRSRQYKYQRK